jgi:molybdenum transport protein
LVREGACVRRLRASGDRVAAGDVLLEAEAPAAVLHLVWRTAQTLIEHASGIADATACIVGVARAAAPDVIVECTRKGAPGTRALAVRAVLAGGGGMHRLGLSDSILIFAEHAAFLGGWAEIAVRIPMLKRAHPGKRIMAEAHTVADALRLAEAGADVVQLDKFATEAVRAVVEKTRDFSSAPTIAAAGGIDARNAGAYAATGCAVLVTSAPLWAPPADIVVGIEPI